MTSDDGTKTGAELAAFTDTSADEGIAHVNEANDQRSTELAIVDEQGATVVVKRTRRNLEMPWNKSKLIAELAMGQKSQQQLAVDYGCTRSAIAMFKQRHLSAIEERAEQTTDDFVDLWIADKRGRLATLQQAAEKLAEKPDARSAEVLAKLLKDAAEELGDLPTRAGVQVALGVVKYEVAGIDLSALM